MTASRRLEGKVALVVGGGRGIGRACAQRLADEGATVMVADVDAQNAHGVAAMIEAAGGRSSGIGVDVAVESEIADMVRACVDAFGRIDVLHNNAADTRPDVLGRDVDVLGMTADLWDRTMAVNVRGPMLTCKHVLPHMISNGGGSIVNTSSASGLTGDLVRTAYAASKAALNSLTWSIATMYGKHGVRCNAIAPGLILSERHQSDAPEATSLALSHHLTPQVGTPDDIAAAVAYLASDDAAFVTGHILRVDGGLLVHMPMVAQQRE
ncbi:MAG TPA: SDR family oxidoreductase [Acidimicrobiales bacterium]|nr:SDR family oxidoreductase [Acidimicrobiales bacterium]